MRFVALALMLSAFTACATAPKTSSGEYAYSDQQIKQNQEMLREQDPSGNSENFPTSAAVGAAASALLNSATMETPHISTPHIDGVCVVSDAVQESACVGVTLILTDSRGNEVSRTNTSKSGAFLFLVSGRSRYTIKALSAHYAASADPAGPLLAGSHVNLKLQVE